MPNPGEREESARVGPGRRRDDAESFISRTTLYSLFSQAPAIIAVLRGPAHIFELVNPGYQNLFQGRELTGRSIREALPEIAGQGFFELLDHVYATGQSHVAREAPVRLRRTQDGELEEAIFNFVYQPMYTEEGEIEGIIIFAFEVTHEVRARRQGEQRLWASEESFRLLVECVQDYAIFMLDSSGNIVTWNSGAHRIQGYKQDEIIGRHFSIFYPEEDVRAGKPDQLLAESRQRGRVEDQGWRLRKDGTKFWADVVITAVKDNDGHFGFAEVTRDVTTRRKAMETERALAVAQEVNRAKDEFLAVISHELRTPLTSILGWARMLRIGGLGEETTLEALQALERSAQAQVHLVEDLLDDTRITSGKLRLNKRPLQVKSIVDAAIADLGPSAETKDVHIVADVRCGTCPMDGDPTRLQQVVWNILSNAIKFTPAGGTINVVLDRNDDDAVITVQDTGRGISTDLLPHLFQRFRQGETTGDRKAGVGLGLAISKYLVEQHGGAISASSAGAGSGATFTIKLPLSLETPEEFKPRDHNRAADLPDLSGIRVLIVEDEADNRDVLTAVIRHCAGEVNCAESAGEGFAILKTWNPDVIICDIALPDLDGCHFIQQVRKERDTPALALTVFGSAEEEERVRKCGFDVFRQKPIEPADLAHEIDRLARRAAVR